MIPLDHLPGVAWNAPVVRVAVGCVCIDQDRRVRLFVNDDAALKSFGENEHVEGGRGEDRWDEKASLLVGVP